MKILNFGSLNIDFVYQVDHFVQPSETISSRSLHIFCGGKGLNQSIALANAGAEIYHAGIIGEDGERLAEALTDNGVKTDFLRRSSANLTGHAIIQIDRNGQNCIILNGGTNQDITPAFIDEVLFHFDSGDFLLVQNEISTVSYLIMKAHERGMTIFLNPSPFDEKIDSFPLDLVDYFILNELEGNGITGEASVDRITEKLIEKYPECRVVLTLGKDGVRYRDKMQSCDYGIFKVPVVDTTAAGDTFTGYFITCLTEGFAIRECLIRASIASSIAVSRLGAANSIPMREEVEVWFQTLI